MVLQIELDPETEARLITEAEDRGLEIGAYAESILRRSIAAYPPKSGLLTPESLERITARLTQFSQKMPVLSLEANDRESYYEDHR